jgi:hypothetical protein
MKEKIFTRLSPLVQYTGNKGEEVEKNISHLIRRTGGATTQHL